jgi:hypothetical protein
MDGLAARIRAWRAERRQLYLDRQDAKRDAERDALERGELQHPMWPMGGIRRRFPNPGPREPGAP